MKLVVNYLNFVYHIVVKIKFGDESLNFVFQFIKNTRWHFGYTDFICRLQHKISIQCAEIKPGQCLAKLYMRQLVVMKVSRPSSNKLPIWDKLLDIC